MRARRLLLALVFFDVLVLYLARFDPGGYVHLWLLPQGEGIFLLTPRGHAILLDGPPDPVAMSQIVGSLLPPVGGTLDLAVVAREGGHVQAAQAEMFLHFPPGTAWRVTAGSPQPEEALWEDRAGENIYEIAPVLTHTVDGVHVSVASVKPTTILVDIGRARVVYAPHARWEGHIPGFARGALVWMLAYLRYGDGARTLAPIVVLPPLEGRGAEGLAFTLLRHPHTLFLVGETTPLHIITDGRRYRWEWDGSRGLSPP